MFENAFKGKKILITGHTGFKGTWLTEWLLQLGADVAGFSLYEPSTPCNFKALELEKRITHFTGNICNLNEINQAVSSFKPEIVFHLAAQPIVRRSYENPIETFETNVLGTAHILESLRGCESVKACVLITSDKCYENVEWEYGYRENDTLGGADPYSASKACAEIVASSYFRSFFQGDANLVKLATARAGNVIGGGDWAQDRIVPDCIRAWSDRTEVSVRNPASTRPWQHVLEPLSGYLVLATHLLKDSQGVNQESFNFGPSAEVNQPVIELLEQMKKYLPDLSVGAGNQAAIQKKEAGLLKLSCDKSLQRLRWKPVLTFEETVRLTSEWYLAYYKGEVNMATKTIEQLNVYKSFASMRGLEWAQT